MRVLHVDTGRELRGGQWQVFYLLKGLAADGHTSLLLAPRLSPLYELASSQGWEVRPVGLASLARLSRRVDLTHLHDARAHTLAALAARGPWVVARRVAFPVRRDLISRWKYARAPHYIAVSKHVKQTLTAAGVAAEKVSVVYDGVPIPAASPGGSWVVAPATEDPQRARPCCARRRHWLGSRCASRTTWPKIWPTPPFSSTSHIRKGSARRCCWRWPWACRWWPAAPAGSANSSRMREPAWPPTTRPRRSLRP